MSARNFYVVIPCKAAANFTVLAEAPEQARAKALIWFNDCGAKFADYVVCTEADEAHIDVEES